MLIGSAVTVKIAYALAKDMVNFEAAKRLAPNLIDSSKRWLSETIQQHRGYQQVVESDDDDEGKKSPSTVSTEYLVHNWLEALFAWFQIVILWHEPSVSLSAITGLLSSFLFLTYFAPRFYATLLIAIFVFNLYKFWFRHVWPEIRVPPGKDREDELKLDMDRWTYLHPQLMTLAELNQHVGNFMNLAEKYLYNLLELRQRKPVVFCSKLCFVFVCTAIIGNTFSGLCLIFIALITLMTAPGIYVHLLPDDLKHWLRQTIGQKLFSNTRDEPSNEPVPSQHEAPEKSENILPDSTSESTSKMPREYISSSLSSTTKSIEQLFETLKQRSFPLMRTEPKTSKAFGAAVASSANEDDDDCTDSTHLVHSLPSASEDCPTTRKFSDGCGSSVESRHRRKSSHFLGGSDESEGLLESDEDQQDGFVML